jgi:toxin ParE1/3/4
VATLKIQFTDRALYEMREILGYIAQDNPLAASRLAGLIMKGLEHKARFPKSGRRIPEIPKHHARELVIPPCRIFYSIDAKFLHVLSMMRGERQFDVSQLGN